MFKIQSCLSYEPKNKEILAWWLHTPTKTHGNLINGFLEVIIGHDGTLNILFKSYNSYGTNMQNRKS